MLLAALLALAASPTIWLRSLAVLTLGWWLPGLLLALNWRLPGVEMPAFLLIGFGLGACWMALGALLGHAIPGPLALWQLSAIYAVPALGLILALIVRPPPLPATVGRSVWVWGFVLLALAAALRLPGLGYHEFHADEAVLLRQAGRAVEGQDDALAEHTKGPGEIALTLALYRGVGTVDEGLARLPFGLMSVGSVLATAWLGRRLLGPHPGFWAGVLLAMNGFALGLSRIAQYQAAILLLSALAVLAAWEFSRASQWRWLALAATFSACGLVIHYEFGLLAPALALLVWLGVRRSADRRRLWITMAVATLAGGALLAAAYVPALLAPYFATTQGYLTNRMGTVGTFNLPFFVEMGTFYNSTYFFAGLIILVTLGTVMGWRRDPAARGGVDPVVAAVLHPVYLRGALPRHALLLVDGKLVPAGCAGAGGHPGGGVGAAAPGALGRGRGGSVLAAALLRLPVPALLPPEPRIPDQLARHACALLLGAVPHA